MNHDRYGQDDDGGRGTAGGRRDRVRRHDPEAESAGAGLSSTALRTGAFVAAGLGMLLLGWAVQPRFRSAAVKPEEERVLFPDLAADPAKAASLEIVSYDDELSTLHPFKVVQSGGVWVLPAHDNYPADAKEHLAAASTALIDLKMLDRVSESIGDHETFGVIEPDPEKIKPGMTGIGQLVEIRDASGNKLARLIVGKEDKRRSGGDGPGKTLRFVRRAGQDPVYRAEIDTAKLTSRFGDWIEKDLLKLSPWDVRRIGLDDYALELVESGGRIRVEQNRKNRLDLAYDDKNAKWSLLKLVAYTKDGEPKEEQLGADEELAAAKLNDLRNALGDLKIVDVARKPAGLSADLRAAESFTNDREAVTSLQQRGFLPLKSGDILSTDGETIVGMKDGVEYVLRFGASTAVSGEAAKNEPPSEDEAMAKAKNAPDTTGRYLLVMARFNEDLLDKPQLEPLPDAPAAADAKKPPADGDKEPDAKKEADPASGNAASEAKPQGNQADKPAGDKPAGDKPAGDKPAGDSGAAGAAGAAGQEAALAGEKPADDKKPDAADKSDAKPTADAKPSPADGKKADGDAATALKKADEEEAKAQAAIENRRRIERENRRKQDEYDDRVKAAQRRVRELNNRFADWYYVVPSKEYAKIHLGRAEVVQQAKPKDAPAAVPPLPGE